MNSREVQLDELLVEFGSFLAKGVDDVLEVSRAHVGTHSLEMSHRGLTWERLDFLEVGDEDLSGESAGVSETTKRVKSRSEELTSRPAAGST
jgi:hypothetical protein